MSLGCEISLGLAIVVFSEKAVRQSEARPLGLALASVSLLFYIQLNDISL